jgi:perosamine synthetase
MLPQKALAALKTVLHHQNGLIALHEPHFGGNEWAYVKECIDTGWVSSAGKFVDKFESMLAEYTGVKRAIAVVNGSAALHIALKLVGVIPGDEVLVPALTFVATANAVCYCGAIPHFVDSEEKTLGLDPYKLAAYLETISELRGDGSFNKQTGRRIRAVVPMHTFGHPVDLDPLMEVCKKFHLEMVEDAAESLGSLYKNKHTGHWGRLSALSFNGNKPVTTGGGGAIITNDEKMGKLAKHLTTTAKVPHRWAFYHDQTGYNYRLPNINAALGCAQLEQLPSFLERKRALAQRYSEAFAGLDGLTFFTEPKFARSNYWLNVFLLDKKLQQERDKILELTNSNGIMTRPAWTLMQKLPMFANCPRMDLSVAEILEARLINIPSSVGL